MAWLPATSVLAPYTTVPVAWKLRMQLIESRFSTPCCGSFIKPVATGPVVPSSGVPIPAGAFHTPRALSVVAYAPATYPLGATAIGSPLTGSVVLRYGKYSAPFWLCGMLPIRLSILGRPLPMTWKAVACSGGSTIAKARLRSANDNAALITTLSATPGTTRMLKISTLSSDEFSWKTGRKSLALKVVVKPAGSPPAVLGSVPSAKLVGAGGTGSAGATYGNAVPYEVPVIGCTLTNDEMPLISLSRLFGCPFWMVRFTLR